MTTDTMVYDMNMTDTQIATHAKRSARLSHDQIKAYAEQDAKYFAEVFCEKETDIVSVVEFFVKCHMAHTEFSAGFKIYITLLRYFRQAERGLPAHYFDVAASDKTFIVYCKHLMFHLISLA